MDRFLSNVIVMYLNVEGRKPSLRADGEMKQTTKKTVHD